MSFRSPDNEVDLSQLGLVTRALLCLALIGAEAQSTCAAAADVGTASVDAGKKLFDTGGCWECHGFEGQGGLGTGPRISPPNMLPPQAFARQLRHPISVMPPYEPSVLSDTDIESIYAFLHSLPQPPSAAQIPALKQ
jgi:ubiquinol-cytochrome c reductase cytochrome c subunit